MKKLKAIQIATLLLSVFFTLKTYSQDSLNSTNQIYSENSRGFHFGLTLGSLFANQYTAGMYDGFGFDIDGNKNSFDNSFMNQKINFQYGGQGYPGQTDQIAQALKVDPGTWTFSEENMPINMRYTPAFIVGLSVRYTVDKKNAILFNVNASKLNISGNFNIRTPISNSASSNQVNNNSLQTFAIKGGEQRLMIQLGYQRIFGDNDKFNFLMEGGLHATLTQFDKNVILINSLQIDLTSYYNQPLYPSALPFKRPNGIGFGAFTGFGVNVNMNPKAIIQLVYSPSFEKINIGVDPQLKLQNSIILRLYYSK